MDKRVKYRKIVESTLSESASTRHLINAPGAEFQLIFDEKHGQYQLFRVGWEGLERIHYCVFH